MVRVLLTALVVAGAAGAWADDAPVTKREFTLIFSEVEAAMNRGLKLAIPERKAVADKAAMSRSAMLKEFEQLLEQAKPKFTMTPRPYRFDEELIKKHNKGEDARRVMRMARLGLIAPAGPLSIGPDAGLTPAQFGDALGMFVSQIAALSHHPNPLWTPGMMKDN